MLLLLLFLLKHVSALTAGTTNPNTMLAFPIQVEGAQTNTWLSLDANWRWWHTASGANCFDSGWSKQYCPDNTTCSNNCVIDGVPTAQWVTPYGAAVSGSNVTINYVTASNVGSRLFLVSQDKKSYEPFDMRNKEISFDVDVSQIPCGVNGAVYFVEMPITNPYSSSLDASFGVNYGDAQCSKGIKYLAGTANVPDLGACSIEIDLLESNSRSHSMTLHACSIKGVTPCTNEADCANFCDKSGSDINPNRFGNTTFWGRGSGFQVDTTRPFTIVTQFPTDPATGLITSVKRYYVQDGKQIHLPTMTAATIAANHARFGEKDLFSRLGGFSTLTESFARKHVLTLSLWDDTAVSMRWLDSVYPLGSTTPGSYRGPCSSVDTSASHLRATYPNIKVSYANFKLKTLSGAAPSPTPSPPTPSPPAPSPPAPSPPTPSPPTPSTSCAPAYGQCGGVGWTGPTCCKQVRCVKSSEFYSQCLTP